MRSPELAATVAANGSAPAPAAVDDTARAGWRTPLELTVLGAIWGGSFLFMRVAAKDFGALPLVEMRLGLGALILLHGIAKLRGGTEGIVGMVQAHGLPGFLGYGVLLGEVLGPALLILGWHARIGAALIAGNMLVAIALVHLGQLGQLNEQGGWAIELQAMFLATAAAVLLLGPGKYSLNGK